MKKSDMIDIIRDALYDQEVETSGEASYRMKAELMLKLCEQNGMLAPGWCPNPEEPRYMLQQIEHTWEPEDE